MALIPVFKECSRDYLIKKYSFINFPLSEWVQAEISDEIQECNRYDIQLYDSVNRKTISVFIYMNKDSTEVYAVDEVVADINKREKRYLLKETPFADILANMLIK